VKRAKLTAPGSIVIEEAGQPVPAKGQALIEVKACGVCGTDVHAFEGRHPFISPPVVPGHEFAGIIRELGPGVEGLTPGSPVTVEPSLTCGQCRPCLSGRYNICDELKVLGCQADGAMAGMIAVRADKVASLPLDMPFIQASLIEPAAVSVHALSRLDLSALSRLLIIGAGPIGLLAVQAAAAWGVEEIAVSEPLAARRNLALELGANLALSGDDKTFGDEMVQRYGRVNAMDAVLDCAGLELTIGQAVEAVAKGGQVVVVGVPPKPARVNLSLIQDRELEMVGSLMYTRPDIIKARDMIYAGQINTGQLITAVKPLEELGEVLAGLAHNPAGSIKTVITMD
jgi:L-iditol 2-dehydrogenase